jgi:hypothetical protein
MQLTAEHLMALFRIACTPDLYWRETHVTGELARQGLVRVGPKHLVPSTEPGRMGRHQANRWITAAGVRCLQAYLHNLTVRAE